MPSKRTNKFPWKWAWPSHVTPTIFGSTVGYPSDSLASCSVIQLHFLAPSTCLYFYWTSNQPPFYFANSQRLNRYDVCTVYVLLLSDKATKTFVAFVFIWQFFFKCRRAIEENIVRECAFYEFWKIRKIREFLRILKRPTNFKIYAFLRILKQPENYNILYFINLTSTHGYLPVLTFSQIFQCKYLLW